MKKTFAVRFDKALAHVPLIAILRGICPSEAEGAAQVLYHAGFRLIEVPLNSPEPFESIARIRACLPDEVLVGAGTVLQVEDVARLASLSSELVVMPHADTAIIRAAKAQGMICLPGIATPSEAFSALQAGADGLKLFPAEMIPPVMIKAMRAVLPKTTRLFPVGGITPENLSPYLAAGVNGFGLGSALYFPGMSIETLAERAKGFVSAWKMQCTV